MAAPIDSAPSIAPPVAPKPFFIHDYRFQITMTTITILATSAIFIIACMAIKGSITNTAAFAPTVIALSGTAAITLLLAGGYKKGKENLILLAISVAIVVTVAALGITGFVTAKHIGIAYICTVFCLGPFVALLCLGHAWRHCH